MAISENSRQSIIPNFLYSTSSTTKSVGLEKLLNGNRIFPSSSTSIASSSSSSFVVAAPNEPGKIEMYSPAFYTACTASGILSCGLTHKVVTPLDLVKYNMQVTTNKTWNHEAYLLFPAHLEGTVVDHAKAIKTKNERFSTKEVLQIFRQLCAGLKCMHSLEILDPLYAHSAIKPSNVLLTNKKGQSPLAVLDFESASPARKEVQSQSEALKLQEWAAQHCPELFRAPELWIVQVVQVLTRERIFGLLGVL